MLTFAAVMGAWASLYLLGTLAAQAVAPACGEGPGTDRLLVLVPAVLSFFGALGVAWLNRPERRARRRRG